MQNEEGRPGGWYETFTGKRFFVLDPRPEDVCIKDIAHSLSQVVRYRGHALRFYTVAEHSVHVAREVRKRGGCYTEILRGLLHDAAEAYTGDVPSPIKSSIPALRKSDAAIERVIMEKYGVMVKFPPWIKAIDTNIIVDERRAIMCPSGNVWATDHLPPLGIDIRCWNSQQAEAEFSMEFHKLTDYQFRRR